MVPTTSTLFIGYCAGPALGGIHSWSYSANPDLPEGKAICPQTTLILL